MTRSEWRAVASLALIYWLRMLGLFMILPVFSASAGQYAGASPALIGVAVGIYGLTQALLQIPFGMASDRIGRKPVIVAGLLIFVAGSLLAAQADSITTVIIGRALQGAGAISAAVTALLADLTRPQSRTVSMAVLGVSIGAAFLLALIIGPRLLGVLGLDGIFTAAAVFGALALLALLTVPKAPRATAPPVAGALRQAWAAPGLKPLFGGVAVLHAAMTAVFVVVPLKLRDSLDLLAADQWTLFAPVMLCSVLPLPVLIHWAERRGHQSAVFAACIALAALALLGVAMGAGFWTIAVALVAYFAGFNFLEASLPSLVSKAAPEAIRGAALGVYSSAQFFGAFVGGAAGGLLLGAWGVAATLLVSAGMLACWLGFVRHTPWSVAPGPAAEHTTTH